MEYFFIIAGTLMIVTGLIGCIVPVIPSVTIAYAGLWLVHLSERAEFSPAFLIITGILTAFSFALDFILQAANTKFTGGSKRAFAGTLIGMIAGIIFFPPLGMIAGAFLGALIAELSSGKKLGDSLRVSAGSFAAFVAGIIYNVSLCGVMLYYTVKELLA